MKARLIDRLIHTMNRALARARRVDSRSAHFACAALSALMLLCAVGCGTLRRPAPFELPAAKVVAPELGAPELANSPAGSSAQSRSDAAHMLGVMHAMAESKEKHPCGFGVVDPSGTAPLRGVCILLPGILGKYSALGTMLALRNDGWFVLIVAPPLVDRVVETMREHRTESERERGAAVAAEFDRTVARVAEGTLAHLVVMFDERPQLKGKPVLLVGESLGALIGVGLAATGDVPFDAALFVAGGGSLLDVAARSTVRRGCFGDLPIDTPDFCAGFNAVSKLDPLVAAQKLHGEPVVMLTASNDLIVPSATQDALCAALGNPPRYVYEGGHLSVFMQPWRSIIPVAREVAEKVGTKGVAASALFGVYGR